MKDTLENDNAAALEAMGLFLRPMPEPPPSIRSKTREAIKRAILEGIPIADAAVQEGVAPATLERLADNPDAVSYIIALKQWKDLKDHIERQQYPGEAVDAARKLMTEATADSIRMRAIEFVYNASGGKPAPIAPQPVDAADPPAPVGYVYDRPADVGLSASDAQTIDHNGHLGSE